MVVKVIDAIRFLLAILVLVSTIAVFFLLVKKDWRDKLDEKSNPSIKT
jgi:hypothetical protein